MRTRGGEIERNEERRKEKEEGCDSAGLLPVCVKPPGCLDILQQCRPSLRSSEDRPQSQGILDRSTKGVALPTVPAAGEEEVLHRFRNTAPGAHG